jgi:hypothetical protein
VLQAPAHTAPSIEETPVHSSELLLTMYRKMVLARRFEEKAGQAYGQKKIQGFCHLYIGQEAVVVGTNPLCTPSMGIHTCTSPSSFLPTFSRPPLSLPFGEAAAYLFCLTESSFF